MLSILGWLFMGLFAGSIGPAFMPGKEPGRIDGTVLMGVCGALIGGLISGSPFRAGRAMQDSLFPSRWQSLALWWFWPSTAW